MADRYTFQAVSSFAAASNVDVSERVRAYGLGTVTRTNAEEGSVAISTIMVDDPEAGINIIGLQPITRSESSESSNSKIIHRGYIADRRISRGGDARASLRTERARVWAVNVADINSLINRRIMRGSDANRPAETDVARVQWLMTTAELGNLLTDSTYVSTSAPVAMDAADYRNQRCWDILNDVAQQSGKNFFALVNELFAPPRHGLFYDFNHSTAYSSEVRLTNVLADVDSGLTGPTTGPLSTYAVVMDTLALTRDPMRVYSGIVVPYDGGDEYVVDAAILNAFDQYRDTMAPSVNVKTAAKARARGLRYLADAATEADRLDMAYIVPLARVNRLKEGHTFQVKFSHLPGYEDWTWVRALNRSVEALSEEYYLVTLEASPAAGSTPAVATCSTQIPGIVSGSWEEGEHHDVFATPPIVFAPAPTPTPSAPSIVIGLFGGMNQTEPVWRGTQTASVSGFTGWGNSRDGWSGDAASIALAGYKAVSGAAGNMTVTWTGGGTSSGAQSWNAIGLAFETNATSPVQTGCQGCGGGGVGSTVTLGAAPTVGNMFVLARFIESGGTPGTIAGWTLIESGDIVANVNNGCVQLLVRCVEAGDGTVIATGDSSYSHWSFLSEWALT